MRKEPVGSEKIVRATARTVITSLLVFCIALYLIAVFMNRNSTFPAISLADRNAVYTITRTDGSTETYTQNHFSLVTYGDTLTCEIAPLGDVSAIQNGTLSFSLYHCYVSVYCGDALIYEQTKPEKGRMIGHRYYVVPLPDGYEDETITIVAVCSEHDSFSSLINPQIIPADRTTYAFRTGHFATGIMMITLLIGSIFMMILSLVNRFREKRDDGLLSISFLGACVCLWYMGFTGYMQPFVESATFLAVVEYVGLYLVPIALSLFIQNHTTHKHLHIFCIVQSAVLFVFFVFATIMTLFVPNVSYVDYIGWLRLALLYTLIVLLFAEFKEHRAARDLAERALHYGMTVVLAIGALELVRFLVAEQIADTYPWISNSIMQFCILALVFTALMYYGVQLTATQYRRIEQENLKRLAYIDQLTGAPNRAACYERFDDIRKNHITDYVVTFIDINFLKKTNDTWGHDKGDELIQTASDLLKKHFTGEDFFGRWGGDEFVAVHFGTLEETRKIMDEIQQEMDALNASGKHDFTLSEAWGFGESTKEHPIDPDAAIRFADEQMYVEKQKAHAARTS